MNRCNLALPLLAGMLFTSSRTAKANDLHVPSQYPTIQAAVNAAHDGDSVVIADGTYSGPGNEDVGVSKHITVRSENGPANCALDPNGRIGIFISGSPDSAPTVQGLTIRNASPGIYVDTDSTAAILGCVLRDNMGHGVLILDGSDAEIGQCDFIRNAGDGLNSSAIAVTVYNSRFLGNHGTGANAGGGLYVNVSQCLCVGNSGYGMSVAVAGYRGHAVVTDSTVVSNSAGGAFVVADDGSDAFGSIRGSIFWANQGYNTEIGGNVTMESSDSGDGIVAGPDNISANPLFIRNPSPGVDGLWGTTDDDYGNLHLGAKSPCVDTGQLATGGLDLDGNPRFVGPRADMGVYELQGPRIAVTIVSIRRDANRYLATIRLSNIGNGTAGRVRVTFATLGGVAAQPPVPVTLTGNMAPGGFGMVWISFPLTAGAPGSNVPLVIAGTYDGGGTGSFNRQATVQLP